MAHRLTGLKIRLLGLAVVAVVVADRAVCCLLPTPLSVAARSALSHLKDVCELGGIDRAEPRPVVADPLAALAFLLVDGGGAVWHAGHVRLAAEFAHTWCSRVSVAAGGLPARPIDEAVLVGL